MSVNEQKKTHTKTEPQTGITTNKMALSFRESSPKDEPWKKTTVRTCTCTYVNQR